ncbi:hypothetical protein CEXT_782541 [Caerostris extrusa]|uniref:Uncharacterized protein n=1 Tax=Caerostris extrusa TaxID=172846 RepID=A0AAV4MGC3_CAEEX|nr:hypothetical protein CEXT_782541 [Caerostris extrusa]
MSPECETENPERSRDIQTAARWTGLRHYARASCVSPNHQLVSGSLGPIDTYLIARKSGDQSQIRIPSSKQQGLGITTPRLRIQKFQHSAKKLLQKIINFLFPSIINLTLFRTTTNDFMSPKCDTRKSTVSRRRPNSSVRRIPRPDLSAHQLNLLATSLLNHNQYED